MKIKSILALVLSADLLSFLISCSRGGSGQDNTVGVKADDPDMVAAIDQARSRLAKFWRVFEHPEHGESDLCLKVKVSDGDQVEHFWVAGIEWKEGKIRGTISNEPEFVRTVKLGQRIWMSETDISNWMYTRDGKMHGNYTM